MKTKSEFRKNLTPHRALLFGYALITIFGALILSLPISNAGGEPQNIIDALFVATSGISTSGPTVVDIGTHYSLFGQIVLMLIFQVGGIGYMSFIILLMSILGWKSDITTGLLAKESLAGSNLNAYKNFFKTVVKYTFLFESIGAFFLFIYWLKDYSVLKALYYGVFHSVSAFCTAGFGLLPDSLIKYNHSPIVNYTIILVSLFGGIGFFVINDVQEYLQNKIKKVRLVRLSVHSKLALTVTFFIIIAGTFLFYFNENWGASESCFQKLTTSLFQSVSASTTDGFSSMDIGKMSNVSLTYIMLTMFVGASPGSTGGGIKTTTFGLLIVFFFAILLRKKINLFEREIVIECIHNAIIVFTSFVFVAFIDLIVLSITEKAGFLQILFEIISALGNTGLSMGITFNLSIIGKIMLIITMFIGRVGPLSIAYAIVAKPKKSHFSYPKTKIFVG